MEYSAMQQNLSWVISQPYSEIGVMIPHLVEEEADK